MFELHHLTAQEQWDWIRRGDVTPLELVEHYLERIERLDPGLGAFVTVTADAARQRARTLGDTVPTSAVLFGLASADKDLERRAGVRTTFGSRLFAENVPATTDEVVAVRDAAGTISLGKTNTPEFGMPAYTDNLIAGPARNPYDVSLGAGGSSGGAATAVAAGLLPFAPGSDGGGSVRIPAAATGLVGLKPSRGLLATGSAVDRLAGLPVPGPLARTVADAAMLLDGMLERDARGRVPHRFTLRAPELDGPLLAPAVRGEGRYILGVATTSPWDDAYDIALHPEASAALDLAIAELTAVGHGLEEVSVPGQGVYPAAFRTIWQAGAAALPVEDDDIDRLEPLTAWLVRRGRELPARRLVEALAALAGFERAVLERFAPFDAVLTPTLALPPRPVGWFDAEDAEVNFAQQVQYSPFTSFANVSGLPAISLPVHVTAEGLPMGVQLVGRPGGEAALVAIGAQLERRLRWHRRHPPQW
jgi:amidase